MSLDDIYEIIDEEAEKEGIIFDLRDSEYKVLERTFDRIIKIIGEENDE